MTGFVLDCSIAIAWCFEDEATDAIDALLDRAQHEGAIVPALWVWDASNALLIAQRRGRIDREAVQERLSMFDMLSLQMDELGAGAVWRSSVHTLAEAESLSFYDATYLELAIRNGIPLATIDLALRRAAKRHGVTILPLDPV